MSEIKYIVQDVRSPEGDGRKIVAHVCNDLGRMGSGVAKALMDKWPQVRSEYVKWHKTNELNGRPKPFKLGAVQFIHCEGEIVVANVIGQHDIRSKGGIPPVRYEALREGFAFIANVAKFYEASVHVPYLMGCDLAGGDWEVVETILEEELISQGVEVTAYDLFNKRVEAFNCVDIGVGI